MAVTMTQTLPPSAADRIYTLRNEDSLLALWLDLLAAKDVLTAPIWVIVPPEGEIIGRERKQRQALLPVSR